MNQTKRRQRLLLDQDIRKISQYLGYAQRIPQINLFRNLLALTQSDMARIMKVNNKTFHELEKSEAIMTMELQTLVSIANTFDCQLVYFFLPNRKLEDIYVDLMQKASVKKIAAKNNQGLLSEEFEELNLKSNSEIESEITIKADSKLIKEAHDHAKRRMNRVGLEDLMRPYS